MLPQTKENIQNIMNRLQILDFTLDTSGRIHKDDTEKIDAIVRRVSAHKLKLIDELLRLNDAKELV